MAKQTKCASEMRPLIKKRELLFTLIGEYGGTATLGDVLTAIAERIYNNAHNQ